MRSVVWLAVALMLNGAALACVAHAQRLTRDATQRTVRASIRMAAATFCLLALAVSIKADGLALGTLWWLLSLSLGVPVVAWWRSSRRPDATQDHGSSP